MNSSSSNTPIYKVSVVMCTYNGEHYLRQQLNTILSQTYPIYELIIQDDCSSDGTRDIIQEYCEQYTNIHPYYLDRHLGINDNFFTAIDRATGDYIAISDQDDIWLPTKIQNQVHCLQQGKELCFYPACSFVGEPPSTLPKEDQRQPNMGIHRALFTMGIASGHTFMFSKAFWNKYKQHVPLTHHGIKGMYYDSMLYFSAIINDTAAFLPTSYSQHRRLQQSATMDQRTNRSKRNGINLLLQVIRNMGSERRHSVHTHYLNRFANLSKLATFWQDNELKQYIDHFATIYSNHIFPLRFTIWCIQHKDEIFYAKEKHQCIAFIRALLFPISHRDYVITNC